MVAAGLGASIVPAEVISEPQSAAGIVWRPLEPELTRTLALAQRRDKPADTALGFVREALLRLAVTP
jgi:DNA-binding transcriptional LysR family regulator